MFRWIVVFLFLGGAVWAETEVDAYGLGSHDQVPQVWLNIDPDVSVRARILDDSTGALTDVVTRSTVLRLAVEFTAEEGARDRDVRFTCRVWFLDAEAVSAEVVAQQVCYDGRLADGLGVFQPLTVSLRFRPNPSDLSGTAGVMVEVTEEVSGKGKTLTPTYRWEGGR